MAGRDSEAEDEDEASNTINELWQRLQGNSCSSINVEVERRSTMDSSVAKITAEMPNWQLPTIAEDCGGAVNQDL